MIRNLLINRNNWDAPALLGKVPFRYRELAHRALALTRLLPRGEREHVAILLPNGGDFVAALFGVFMAGMTAFPLNADMTVHELAPLLEYADVRTVVTTRDKNALFLEIRQPLRILFAEDLAEEQDVPPYPETESPSPEEPLLLLSTSGTTGTPKLVQLTERGFEYSVRAYIDKMDFGKYRQDEVRYFIAAPYSSVYGLLVLTVCLIRSFPVAVLEGSFSLPRFYLAVQEHAITHYEGGTLVAVLMDRTADRPLPYQIRSLRYLGLAGSKISADVLARLSANFPDKEFWTGYGMTEASPLIAKPYKRMDPSKFASVGTALPGEKIRISANGKLTDLPHVRGEIVVSGPNVMLGYYRNEEETKQTVRDGWLHTGDIGYLDEEGYLYLCGRIKNMILVRGFNVYPEEVEACILGSGMAKDCVVYGESRDGDNEAVCADVVPAGSDVTPEELIAYCAEHLSEYKCPQTVVFVDRIQKTFTGKSKKDPRKHGTA